jgi:hypothetical protein
MENPMHVRSPPPNSHPARTHRSGGKPSHALCMARAPCVGQLSRRNRLSFLFSETHVSTTLKIEPPSAHVRSALLCSALLCSPLPRSRYSNHRPRRATAAASPCSRPSTLLRSASPRRAARRPRLARRATAVNLRSLASLACPVASSPTPLSSPSPASSSFLVSSLPSLFFCVSTFFSRHHVVCPCSRVPPRAARPTSSLLMSCSRVAAMVAMAGLHMPTSTPCCSTLLPLWLAALSRGQLLPVSGQQPPADSHLFPRRCCSFSDGHGVASVHCS